MRPSKYSQSSAVLAKVYVAVCTIGSVMALASLARASPPCTAWVLGPAGLRSSADTSGLQQLDLIRVALDRVGDRPQIGRSLERAIGVLRLDARELSEVIPGLLFRELEPVRGGDHDDALFGTDHFALDELAEYGECYAGVRVVEHAGAVGERRLIGELGFARLFNDAVELLQRAHRALVADRIADLDGAGQRRLRLHRREALEVRQIRAIQRFGILGLGHSDARQLLDQAEVAHHEEALAERADVAEVAARNHDPVRNLPIELLHELDGDRLLALDAQAVHRVGEIDRALLGDLLHER